MEHGKELVVNTSYDKELAMKICEELGIPWNKNAVCATVAGRPISEEIQPERDIPREIGKAVLQLRYYREMTQKKLAEKTGLTLDEIIDIEYGAANPTVDTLNKLANVLGAKLIIDFC